MCNLYPVPSGGLLTAVLAAPGVPIVLVGLKLDLQFDSEYSKERRAAAPNESFYIPGEVVDGVCVMQLSHPNCH